MIECHPKYEEVCCSADLDGNIMIWNIVSGELLNYFKEYSSHVHLYDTANPIYDGRFSSDGQFLVVSSFYGSFSIYGTRGWMEMY